MITEVKDEALDYALEGPGIYLYKDKPFIGIAYDVCPEYYLEALYYDGIKYGYQQWYWSKSKMSNVEMVGGMAHGDIYFWFENGKPKEVSENKFGITLSEKEWDINGELIREFTLQKEPPSNYSLLLHFEEYYQNAPPNFFDPFEHTLPIHWKRENRMDVHFPAPARMNDY